MAGTVAWVLGILAVAAGLGVFLQALRRPILFRMATRNASRRPRQTATVIAGLMIGTAIISASLVAGQSAGSAIRGAVYEALGDVDETVRLDIFNYYPEEVLDQFRADPNVVQFFDGISPNAIWDAAATNPRTDLFEPAVMLVGFDGEADADFRPFELTDGTQWDGQGLGRDEAIVTSDLAEEIDLQVGDTLHLRFTQPLDPFLPDVQVVDDTLTSIGGGLNGAGVSESHTFDVEAGAEMIVSVVGWDPRALETGPALTMLHLELDGPDGTHVETEGFLNGRSSPPLWLNVTSDEPLAVGAWTLTVSAPFAFNTPYAGAIVTLYPVYDPGELQQRANELSGGDNPFSEMIGDLASFLPVETLDLKVRAITDGGRGNQFDFDEAVFFNLETAQDALNRQGEVNVIKFSNPGGIEAGRQTTAEAVDILNATLLDIKADHPHDGAIQHLEVRPVKQQFVQLADDAGQLMTGLLLFAGSLSVITGLLLIINIFTMLAEERRSELGMARAVGMTRRDLVRLFVFEGGLYAVAAAFVGAIVGLGLAAVMVAFMNAVIASLGSGFPPIPLRITADAVLIAFAAGSLLAFGTILVASRRIARLNIVRAIRRIDDPQRTGGPLSVLVGSSMAGVGLLLAVAGWAIDIPYQFSLQVFGPLFVVLGSGTALRVRIPRKPLYPSLAFVMFLYYAVTYFVITEYDNLNEANIVGPIRGVILTLSVVVIASFSETGPRLLGRSLARLKRWRAVATPAVSYPQHKRFRTGMTLAMFSIVILSIGFFSILGGLFNTDPDTQTGGFDIEATTTLDVEDLAEYDRGLIPDGLVAQMVVVDDFFTPDPTLITVSGERTGQFQADLGHHVYGIDEEFVEAQEFRLLWRDDAYADDLAAYEALLARDDVVIVGYQYSTDERNQDLSHEVGEMLQINLGSTPREFTIIGIQEQYHFPGIFLSKPTVESIFPTTSEAFYLITLSDDSDAPAAAKLIEQNYRDAGMNAEASREKVLEEQETFRQILGAMKLFLGLGLLIGVLSLGIVTARSVIERRQEIGVLRALGYTRGMIRRIFLAEMTLVVALGGAIGIACSLLVSFGLWFAIIRELQYPYVVPWGEILLLLGISYGVALLATLAPIRRAARVAPAEALRYVD